MLWLVLMVNNAAEPVEELEPQRCKLYSCKSVEDFDNDFYFDDDEYCSTTCRAIDKAIQREKKKPIRISAFDALPHDTKFDKENNDWALEFMRASELPKHLINLAASYYVDRRKKVTETHQVRGCNIGLRERVNMLTQIIDLCPLTPFQLNRLSSRETLSNDIAEHCRQLTIESKNGAIECWYELKEFADNWSVAAPHESGVEKGIIEAAECGILRMMCPRFWLRRFNRMSVQVSEHLNIAAKLVGKSNPYVSSQSLQRWRNQKRNNLVFLSKMEAFNEDTGETVNLGELAEKTTANPEIRRVELMVRLRGVDELAEEQDKLGLFLTITCPSKYHANSSKWDWKITPKIAQEYLAGQWAKIRAKLKRDGIDYYGCRVTEPHKDGCPHWHMLVFVDKEHQKALTKTVEYYAFEVDGDEFGADKNRFDCEVVDREKGSAVGYIAKYISKNINGGKMFERNDDGSPKIGDNGQLIELVNDGSDMPTDISDNDEGDVKKMAVSEGADRATAWANTWSLRQFQFFGTAPVTIWRELRRIKSPVETDENIETARGFADTSNWSEFTKAIAEKPIELIKEREEQANDYGESIERIVGLRGISNLLTRSKGWVVRKAQALKSDGVASWTRVNKCTGVVSDVIINTLVAMGICEEDRDRLLRGATLNDGTGRWLKIKGNRVIEV